MATIVLDDSTTDLTFGGGQWSGLTLGRYFGGATAWPAFAADGNGDTGTYGNLSFVFRGMLLSFCWRVQETIMSIFPQEHLWLFSAIHLMATLRSG